MPVGAKERLGPADGLHAGLAHLPAASAADNPGIGAGVSDGRPWCVFSVITGGCFVRSNVVRPNETSRKISMASAFVSYLQISTDRHGRSRLGLEAQRRAVADFLVGGSWRHVAELVEVEGGSRDNRPRLSDAMALCRLHGATLVIA